LCYLSILGQKLEYHRSIHWTIHCSQPSDATSYFRLNPIQLTITYQCCSPQLDGGGWWGVFNSIFGWQNSATYGSVISYNLYCIAVGAGFLDMYFREKRAVRKV
jgi:high-affinity Fe2+/Pb2+ permease